METAKIVVVVGKEEAFKVGSAAFGDEQVPVTAELLGLLTEEERVYVAEADHGLLKCPNPDGGSWNPWKYGRLPVPPNFTLADVVSAIKTRFVPVAAKNAEIMAKEARTAEREKAKEEGMKAAREAEVGKLLAMTDTELESRVYFWGDGWNIRADSSGAEKDPRVKARVETLLPGWRAAEAEAIERRRVAKEAEKAADEARKVADKAAFEAYVREHGTPNQIARFEAGVLPEGEIIERRRGELFPADFPAYERLTSADVDCDGGGYRSHDPSCRFTSDAYEGKLSAEAWDRFQTIKSAVLAHCPDAEVEIREHRAWCGHEGCPGDITKRYSVRCLVDWGGHEVVKLYAFEI